MTERIPTQSPIVDQSEVEVVGWDRFVKLLVARGFLVVSLSFFMGGDTVQQRGVKVLCSDGSHFVVPASEVDNFITSDCKIPDPDTPQEQQDEYFSPEEY